MLHPEAVAAGAADAVATSAKEVGAAGAADALTAGAAEVEAAGAADAVLAGIAVAVASGPRGMLWPAMVEEEVPGAEEALVVAAVAGFCSFSRALMTYAFCCCRARYQ